MRVFRSTSASFTTVISLGFLYLTVVVLTVVLSRELVQGPESFQIRFAGFFAVLGLLFALLLLGVLVFNMLRLIRERRQGRPGSTLKGRITVFFLAVVFLSALPQGIVSVSFLSSALDLLFSTNTSTALHEGLRLSLDYYDRNVYDLEQVASDGTLERVLSGITIDDSERIFSRLRERIPLLASIQVFDRTGGEVAFFGAEALRRTDQFPRPAGAEAVVSRLNVGGEAMLRLVAPLGPEVDGTVLLSTHLPAGFEPATRNLTEARSTFARLEQLRPTVVLFIGLVYGVFAAPILLMAMLAGFFLSERIMRPIESLEEATRRVAEGDYTVRILGRPGDDLGVLVMSFNNMVTDLDRTRRRMIQAEKVQAWQEIAQRLAHEVKNPLTPIRLAAERLRRRYHAESDGFGDVLDRTVDTILREVDALSDLLNEFRSFARMPRPTLEPVVLVELLREASTVYRDDNRVHIDTGNIPEDLVVPLDRGQIRQVLHNLISNAVEAAGDQVAIRFHSDIIRKNGISYCRLRMEDDGPGIPEDLADSIFEPYTTSKSNGTGLGLAIVQRIVFDHNGQITCESAPGSGATFILDFPGQQDGLNR